MPPTNTPSPVENHEAWHDFTDHPRYSAPMNRHAQPDLFAEITTPPAFRPASAHVLSGLERLHARLAEAATWWSFTDWDIERFRAREPAYYCGLLDDAALAQDWRSKLDAEITRLDAASGTVRPE